LQATITLDSDDRKFALVILAPCRAKTKIRPLGVNTSKGQTLLKGKK